MERECPMACIDLFDSEEFAAMTRMLASVRVSDGSPPSLLENPREINKMIRSVRADLRA